MLELVLVGAMFVVAMVVVGVVVALASLLGFLVVLPFKILGWTIKLLGMLVALPFLLLAGLLLGGGVLAAVLFSFVLPVLPLVGLGWLIWWLATRNSKDSHARVVS